MSRLFLTSDLSKTFFTQFLPLPNRSWRSEMVCLFQTCSSQIFPANFCGLRLFCSHEQYLLSLIISNHKEEGTVDFHVKCFLHGHYFCNTNTNTRYCGGLRPFFVYINISFMFDFADF